jgi:uncharacterized protein YsxB (DUF464 family)
MVTVRVTRNDGQVTRLRVTGHAGAAPPGEDLVCAGASALVETLALGLERVVPGDARWTVEPGHADFRFDGQDPRQAAVVDTIVAGLEDLAASYPKFVRIRVDAGR